ncbi:MAG TPA: YihY/virulence factor BrkB family protein [Bryobacteraceae bacterium]|nr:YihY/virulence factor BrkB family protein [Bryobacteraceae bacterium]
MKKLIQNGKELASITWEHWNAHHDQMLGASLAYYTVLSLAPLLVLCIAIVGLVFSRDAAQGQIVTQLQGLIGVAGAKTIQTIIQSAGKPATGTVASILGFCILLFGASGVFNALRDSLNMIWEVKPAKTGFVETLREEFLSFGLVLGIGFLLLVSLMLSAAIAALGKFVGGILPVPEAVLHIGNVLLTFAVAILLFAAIYRILPATHIPWSDVWIGSTVTSFLYALGKLVIGIYLGKASVGSAYGAAGSLVVLLVWVYYSAQVFFFGAEFTHAFALRHGSRCAGKQCEVPEPAPATPSGKLTGQSQRPKPVAS